MILIGGGCFIKKSRADIALTNLKGKCVQNAPSFANSCTTFVAINGCYFLKLVIINLNLVSILRLCLLAASAEMFIFSVLIFRKKL